MVSGHSTTAQGAQSAPNPAEADSLEQTTSGTAGGLAVYAIGCWWMGRCTDEVPSAAPTVLVQPVQWDLLAGEAQSTGDDRLSWRPDSVGERSKDDQLCHWPIKCSEWPLVVVLQQVSICWAMMVANSGVGGVCDAKPRNRMPYPARAGDGPLHPAHPAHHHHHPPSTSAFPSPTLSLIDQAACTRAAVTTPCIYDPLSIRSGEKP